MKMNNSSSKVNMNKLEKNRELVYKSIELLPAQIEQAWSVMAKTKIPARYKEFDNIIICGMGGSNIGFHLVQQALLYQIKVPIFIQADYKLPSFVSKNSLVILSSYSGNTEEVLSCAKQVLANKYKGYIITGGGKLSKMIGQIPGVLLPLDFNPSNEPRWGLGYSIGAFLNILKRIKALNITESQFMSANISSDNSDFIALANKFKNKQLVVVAAEHLVGNAHVFCNQLNETADNMAVWLALPEMNHHFMDALSNPKGVMKKKTAMLIVNADQYSLKIRKRIKVTKKVLKKLGLGWFELMSHSKEPLADSLSTLQQLSYLCYYVSVVNKVDPIAIPTVDFFKREMKK